ALPRDRALRRSTYCPADAHRREALLDHLRELPVGRDLAARDAQHEAPDALEGANLLLQNVPPSTKGIAARVSAFRGATSTSTSPPARRTPPAMSEMVEIVARPF